MENGNVAIKENQEQIHEQDQYIEEYLSPEETEKIFQLKINDLPKSIVGFFGIENIREILNLLYSETNKDIDFLSLTGLISYEEVIEYEMTLPEFRNELDKATLLIAKIVNSLEKKLQYYLGKKLKGIQQITTISEELEKALLIPYFSIINYKINTFCEMLNYEIIDLVEKLCEKTYGSLYCINKSKIINHFIKGSPEDSIALQELLQIENVKNFEKYFKEKEKLIYELTKHKSLAEIEIENLTLYETILAESYETEFSSTDYSHKDLDIKIQFEKDFISNNPVICLINFSNSLAITGKISVFSDNIYIVNPPVQLKQYCSHELHERIKFTIFNLIMDYLKEQPKREIEVLEDTKVSNISDKVIEKTSEQLEKIEEPQPFIIEKFEYIQPPVEKEETDIQEEPQTIKLPNLPALKGKEVKRILINILGKPLRQRGSHYIFEGKGISSNRTHVLGLHETDTVGIGMLLRFLKTMGITEEFYDIVLNNK